MTAWILDFDSKTAQILSQEDGCPHGRLASRFQINQHGHQGATTEEEFFTDLAQEVEAIFTSDKGAKLILRAIPRDRKRLERHLSSSMVDRLILSSEDKQAG